MFSKSFLKYCFLAFLIILYSIGVDGECSTFQCDECGVTFEHPNVRIVGGKPSVPRSWPSVVLVLFRYDFNLEVSGKTIKQQKVIRTTGALIKRDIVLLSASFFPKTFKHIYKGVTYDVNVEPNEFHPTFESMYEVYLGLQYVQNALKDLDLKVGVKRSVSNFDIHPSFDEYNYLNDIALIQLKDKVDLNNRIQIACLPDPFKGKYPLKTNIKSYGVGYGKLKYDGQYPLQLHNVKLTIYPNSYCKNVLPDYTKNWKTQMCAGDIMGKKDTCIGDSPLFVNNNFLKKFVLVGLASYGDECATYGKGAIYTRVSEYMKWIIDTIHEFDN